MDLQYKLRGVSGSYPGLQFAMVLVAEHEGLQRCVGTAFGVAPGLAITAGHVIDECVHFQQKRDGFKRRDVTFSITAAQLYDEKVLLWSVDAIYGSKISDIAFLRFSRPAWWGDGPGQVKPRYVRLNFNPPRVGDKLRVFGFPQSELREGMLYVSPSESECYVQKVEARTAQPAWNKPLAYIELEGEIEHGMSGGPCFDQDWNVIGVNSSAWVGIPLAKVALLWPAMKVEIDLFKTGPFPAVNLFRSGAATALGYRRVYVTSKGEARFAKVDPDGLVPLDYMGMTEHIPGAVDFAGSGAQEALAELRASLAGAQSGPEPLNSNKVLRLVRHYFWELEAVLRLAILLAARQANLSVPEPPTWEQLLKVWKAQTPDGDTLDKIAALEFDWNGVDLFELRAYAELSRSGIIGLQSISAAAARNKGQIIACSLDPPCRKGSQQIPLPDGLDRFMDAARWFVQRLLRFSGPLM